MQLVVQQNYVRFDEISIGSLFYFSDRFWTRTSHTAGSELSPTTKRGSCCSFRVYPQDEEFNEFYVDQRSGWFMVQAVEIRK